MKGRSILIVAAILLMSAADTLAQSDGPVDFVMNSKWEFRDRSYEYTLNSDDLKNTPAWNPTAGEPPLSISQALKIAEKNTSIFVPDARGWEPISIRLTSTSQGKWYYFVTFGCTKPVCVEGAGRGFNLLVKLDGTVQQPKILSIK